MIIVTRFVISGFYHDEVKSIPDFSQVPSWVDVRFCHSNSCTEVVMWVLYLLLHYVMKWFVYAEPRYIAEMKRTWSWCMICFTALLSSVCHYLAEDFCICALYHNHNMPISCVSLPCCLKKLWPEPGCRIYSPSETSCPQHSHACVRGGSRLRECVKESGL